MFINIERSNGDYVYVNSLHIQYATVEDKGIDQFCVLFLLENRTICSRIFNKYEDAFDYMMNKLEDVNDELKGVDGEQ